MSEKLQQKNAEIDYINAMLCVEESATPLVKVPNQLIDQFEIDKEETVISAVNNTEINNCIADKNRYQLFLIAGFKVAVLQSAIHAFVDVSEIDMDDNVLLYESKNFDVVDIKSLMELSDLSNKPSKYILLSDLNIALNCEEILGVEKIEDGAVCWRDENSKRRWLAGTVKKRNIILLDKMSLHNIKMMINH